MGFQVVEIDRRDLVFRWRSLEGTSNFSFYIKGIARCDSKLLRSPEGVSYFDGGRQKGPHISVLNKRNHKMGFQVV